MSMTVRVEAECADWEGGSYNLRISLWAAEGISVGSINVSYYTDLRLVIYVFSIRISI